MKSRHFKYDQAKDSPQSAPFKGVYRGIPISACFRTFLRIQNKDAVYQHLTTRIKNGTRAHK